MSLGASDTNEFLEAADFKVTEIAEYRRVKFGSRKHTVSAPVAPLRRSDCKHARATSPVAGLSHRHNASAAASCWISTGRYMMMKATAREFAIRYPEEWEERFASTYNHLL
ncbi:hypothetical protein GGX14DRAFT_403893 [Mycena pura]|uniref:Uncharacterized protein n=1 Tax=Mycena pura TaxID=153505 RepID=A0AAD6UVC0_9AGAR|nr:hypothetical protein GGX14DRAFT_403893 [Mycena pura]